MFTCSGMNIFPVVEEFNDHFPNESFYYISNIMKGSSRLKQGIEY